jgi:hypothetical protein
MWFKFWTQSVRYRYWTRFFKVVNNKRIFSTPWLSTKCLVRFIRNVFWWRGCFTVCILIKNNILKKWCTLSVLCRPINFVRFRIRLRDLKMMQLRLRPILYGLWTAKFKEKNYRSTFWCGSGSVRLVHVHRLVLATPGNLQTHPPMSSAKWQAGRRISGTHSPKNLEKLKYIQYSRKQCCGSGSRIRDPGSGAFYPLDPDPGWIFSGTRIPDPRGMFFGEIFLRMLVL